MKGLLKSAIRDDDPVLVFEDVNLWAKKEPVFTSRGMAYSAVPDLRRFE